MMRNRALDLLREAYGLVDWYNRRGETQILIRLAIDEVHELHARIAQLERYIAAHSREIVNVQPATLVDQHTGSNMTPARLTERQRPAIERRKPFALPDNGGRG
jgi:hypothetical protein